MIPGLSSKEASERLLKYGKNEIESSHKVEPLKIFLSQFKSILILILLAAAPIAYFAGEKLDAFFIFAVVLLNGLFGFVQEYRAEKAIAALKRMVVEKVRVIRDNKEIEIDAKGLVPGDIFIIDEGQKIPADAKLVEAFSLNINEAPLTGESQPVLKEVSSTSENDDQSFVFMGTSVESGRGVAEVVSTGMSTRFGKIAKLLKEIQDEETPLQKNLGILGKQLGILAVFGSVLVFALGVFYGKEVVEMLLTGVSLAVAVVPEGLPAVVTITLAIGIQRMARVSSIIRKLSSIEAIGSVDIILSDKTGTITKNEMVVKKVFFENQVFELKNLPKDSKALQKIMKIGTLCSATSISRDDRGKTTVLGDRTEGAILTFAQNEGLNIEETRASVSILNQFPFDSKVKMMSVVYEGNSKEIEVLTKGAVEIVLGLSTKIMLGGEIVELDGKIRQLIETNLEEEASKGLRLIAFGFKSTKVEAVKTRVDAEKDLIFAGFVSIYDPPREGVREAINLARRAGITVAMITGDNPLTARAIAQEIGLVEKESGVLTGKDLDKITQDELKKITESVRIYARVSPEHKLRIVQAFQERGFAVSVTGDGVNDSPALKQADVGMAMGIIGTDVAKEASDMVIADDNFSSIVKAVEEGRVVYENILKSIRYLLSCNSGELLAILGAVAIGLPSPLTPVQILWMNLVTDGLPALALAEDPKNPKVMDGPPRNKSISIIKMAGKVWIIIVGVSLGLLTLSAFILLDHAYNLAEARTVAFSTLVIGEMVVAFLVRRKEKWYSNRWLLIAIAATVFLQFLIVTVPPLQKLFDTTALF